jgi:hypothetical protein
MAVLITQGYVSVIVSERAGWNLLMPGNDARNTLG